MSIVTLQVYQAISDGGDGSYYIHDFQTEADREAWYARQEEEGEYCDDNGGNVVTIEYNTETGEHVVKGATHS